MSGTIEAAKMNRHGSACPDWCHIDHAHVNVHTGTPMDLHMSEGMASGCEYPRVALTQSSSERGDGAAEVHVSALPGFVFVSPAAAGNLADLIQSLADCTPQRLRDLADEIRIAASILTK